MVKIHRLENGDIIKIVPMVFNNKLTWIKKYDCCFVDNKIIYDVNGYLRKISADRRLNGETRLLVSTKYFLNIYIDGETRFITIGRTLYNLIDDNPDLLDIKSNKHIFIVKDEFSAGGNKFPSFEKSYVYESIWTPPIGDKFSDSFCYIDLYDYIKENDVFSKKQILIDNFGYGALSEVISDDRQIKLDEVLNSDTI